MNDKKILVVEDDKDLISLIKFNLKSEGFNVLLSPVPTCRLELIHRLPTDVLRFAPFACHL